MSLIMIYPEIKRRYFNKDRYEEALRSGASQLQSIIIANRDIPEGIAVQDLLNPSLNDIPAGLLQDADKAANRIVKAITRGEVIGFICDFDVDGISSAALLYKSLVDFFGHSPLRAKVYISNRMKHGYGFRKELLDKIKLQDPIPTLLITADQGSKDGPVITEYQRFMRDKGMIGDVIVTDHHNIDVNMEPKDAFAFVNPQRETCEFPDKSICGCVVAMLVMTRVRKRMIELDLLKEPPKMGDIIPFGAAATIADCSSLASPYNRAFVRQGLRFINQTEKENWMHMRSELTNDPNQPIMSETIAFGLAPRINASSRTGHDGLSALKFYLSESANEAARYFNMISSQNTERREIEKKLFGIADYSAESMFKAGYDGFSIYLPNGHRGIHGIVSSGISRKYGKPIVIFSPDKHTEKEIDFSEIPDYKVDVFSKLDSDYDIEVKDGHYINVRKLGGQILPTFFEKSYKGNDQWTNDEITLDKALTLTRKSLFKGIKRGRYEHEVEGGHIIFDLSSHTKPKFYIKRVETISGSGRSVEGINISTALEEIEANTDLLERFGGHDMAAGMVIKLSNFESFKERFNKNIQLQCQEKGLNLYPYTYSDGDFPDDRILDLDFIDEIHQLEPFGNGFDYPSFEIVAQVNYLKKTKSVLSLRLEYKGILYKGVWFKIEDSPYYGKLELGKTYRFLVSPKDEFYKGRRSISLHVQNVVL